MCDHELCTFKPSTYTQWVTAPALFKGRRRARRKEFWPHCKLFFYCEPLKVIRNAVNSAAWQMTGFTIGNNNILDNCSGNVRRSFTYLFSLSVMPHSLKYFFWRTKKRFLSEETNTLLWTPPARLLVSGDQVLTIGSDSYQEYHSIHPTGSQCLWIPDDTIVILWK